MNYRIDEKVNVETKVTKTTTCTAQIVFDEMVVSQHKYLRMNAKAWSKDTSVNKMAKCKVTTSEYLSDQNVVLKLNGRVVAQVTVEA